MGFLRRFGHRPTPVVVTEWAADDSALKTALDEIKTTGSWMPAARLLAATGRDWDRRSYRVEALAESAAPDMTWLAGWCAERPDDPDAHVLRAKAEVLCAWNARGSAYASQTSDEAMANFATILRRAQQWCVRAIELNPDDPTPWVARLWLVIGGQESPDSFRSYWKETCARDPYNRAGYIAALQFSSEKWYGSHEQMYEFAETAASEAPKGSPLVVVPLQAHCEYMLREHGDHRVAVDPPHPLWTTPRAQADIDRAMAVLMGSQPPMHALMLHDMSVLGYALAHAGRWSELAAVFDRTSHHMFQYPWYYQNGGASEAVAAAHRKAMNHRG